MEKEFSTAVFIGRFQPFHNSHLDVVKQGLEIADKVLILVGSSCAARSVKNPFTYAERKEMIELACGTKNNTEITKNHKISVHGVRDYYYSPNTWLAAVQAITDQHTNPGDSVALLGAFKDSSSGYLNSFPQWEHVAAKPGKVHATDIRESLYSNSLSPEGHILKNWEGKLPDREWRSMYNGVVWRNMPLPVQNFIAGNFSKTSEFANLCDEWKFNLDYKKSWESAPFPPTFNTVDAVVECSGHVLVVQRKFNPGKGLHALPGGFLKQTETTREGALRELREETGIRVDKLILDANIVGDHVFDHPERSVRGRTITRAFHIKLRDGELPEVKGKDDAEKAFWMPLWDVTKNEEFFFEDHSHIIQYFVGGAR